MTISAFCRRDEYSRPRRSDDGVQRKPAFTYVTFSRVNTDGSTSFIGLERNSKAAAFRFWTVEEGEHMLVRYSYISETSLADADEFLSTMEELEFTPIAQGQESFNAFIDAGASAWDYKNHYFNNPEPVRFCSIY